jgi:hypothetical protein
MASVRWRMVVTASRATARRPLLCLLLLGMAVQLSLPGLWLAAMAAADSSEVMCHLPGPGGETPGSPGGGESSTGAGCCLICLAMQSANGALPAPTLQTPTVSWVAFRMPIALSVSADGHSPLHHRARGPPA